MLVNLYTDNAWYFAGIIPSILIVLRCLIVYVITFFADRKQRVVEKNEINYSRTLSTGRHQPVAREFQEVK